MTNQEKVRLHEYFCHLKEILTSREAAVLVCVKIREKKDVIRESFETLQRWTSLMIRLDRIDEGEFFDGRLNLKKEINFFLEEMAFIGLPVPEKPAG